MILAGDIGGTKSLLGLFDEAHGPGAARLQVEYPSAAYPSLEALVAEFLRVHGTEVGGRGVEWAAFAVAGPMSAGRVQPTNLDWPELVDHDVAGRFGWAGVRLLNDLEAVALGITATGPDDLEVLAPGTPRPGGAVAVIAPGTGLGEAFLTWDGSGWAAHPSEGGHCDFAPVDALEIELLQHLLGRFEHVSYEHVCSGVGIPHLYDFLAQRTPGPEPGPAAAMLDSAADRARAIVELGTDPAVPSPRCREVVALFTRILGSEAGNLALKVLATGGIYLAGGLALAARRELAAGPFLHRARSKGRLSRVLDDVPVSLLTCPVALRGAAVAGLRRAPAAS